MGLGVFFSPDRLTGGTGPAQWSQPGDSGDCRGQELWVTCTGQAAQESTGPAMLALVFQPPLTICFASRLGLSSGKVERPGLVSFITRM